MTQDTSAAARQAITDQAPGSEFNPPPHPEMAKIQSDLIELEKRQQELFNKLFSGAPGTYMERDKLHSELAEVDRAVTSLNRYAQSITLGYREGTPKVDTIYA